MHYDKDIVTLLGEYGEEHGEKLENWNELFQWNKARKSD